MDYLNARKGLKTILLGEALAGLGVLLGFAMSLVVYFPEARGNLDVLSATIIVALVAAGLTIVGFIVTLFGLNIAGKDETYFESAFWVSILTVVLKIGSSLLSYFVPSQQLLYSSFDAIGDVCSVVIMVLIINGISIVLEKIEAYDLSDRGRPLSMAFIAIYIVSIILGFLPSFFKNPGPEIYYALRAFESLSALVEAVVYILFIIYVYKAIKRLKKNK